MRDRVHLRVRGACGGAGLGAAHPPGFTSAYAEPASSATSPSRPGRVHLRVRGACAASVRDPPQRPGSPLHTRSLRPSVFLPCLGFGFTSAYAEPASTPRWATPSGRVHLRIRGACRTRTRDQRGWVGSPPHTRSLLDQGPELGGVPGFTSAYAEPAIGAAGRTATGEVHLRLRGACLTPVVTAPRKLGSPPHTRSLQQAARDGHRVGGFTSAYAEPAGAQKKLEGLGQVHLRIRGACVGGWLKAAERSGSPPHTRSLRHVVFDGGMG